MLIRPATPEDIPAITAIYNSAVLNSTASFDVEPKSIEDRHRWLAQRLPQHPVLVAEEDAAILGWGALSPYSERVAYARTAEVSVYVEEGYQMRGVGRAVSVALLQAAARAGLHAVLARICTENAASLAMMRSLGFTETGTLREVGCKFGRWLDVVTWEFIVGDEPCVS